MQDSCCSPSIRQVQLNSCCGSAQVPNKFLPSLTQWSDLIFTSQSPIFAPVSSTHINYQNTRQTRTRKLIWLQDFIHHHTKKQVALLVDINHLRSKLRQKCLNLDNDTSIFKWLSSVDFFPFNFKQTQDMDMEDTARTACLTWAKVLSTVEAWGIKHFNTVQ